MRANTLLLSLLLAAPTGSAFAATFNFIELIDGGAAGGSYSGTLGDGTLVPPAAVPAGGIGEDGYQSFNWTIDGFTLTATGERINNDGSTSPAFAYLDSNTAGLGVCKSLNGRNQCDPSSDDNTTLSELLNITFNTEVSIDISALEFRNAGHALYNNSDLNQVFLSIDGGNTLQNISSLVGSMVTAQSFEFSTRADGQQFYISSMSAVPIPAAAWLFGSALIGLAGISRRRKAAS